MKFKLFSFLCLAICFAFLGGLAFSNTNVSQSHAFALTEETESNVYNEIDAYLADACKKAHFPAMSVTIVSKDNVLLSKSYGNCENTDTPFLLGSVSKSINKMFYENVEVDANIPYKYGMGWNLIEEPLKESALRHAGLVETGMSTIYILPESEIGIAIAVNTNDYFVGKDLMDRIDWSIALMLMGDEPNQIGANEYITRHLLYDLAYFIVFAISILPICLIMIFKKRLSKGKLPIKIILLVSLHLVLPIFILLLPQIFFATPLWVVRAFVPDMFTTIIVSFCLLFIGGVLKSILLILNKIKKHS